MKWIVKNFDCHKQKIIDYDLFPHFKTFLLELKKKKKTFLKGLKHQLETEFSLNEKIQCCFKI